MRNTSKKQNKGCCAVMGTLTNAQKAQKALSAAAIPTGVNKSENPSAHRGCVWSVNFSCNQIENVKAVLSAAGIGVKAWECGDDIL